MAKGDSDRSQNQIDQQGGTAQNNLNNLYPTFNNQYANAYSNYSNSVPSQLGNYNSIMGNYNSFLAGNNPGQAAPSSSSSSSSTQQPTSNTGGNNAQPQSSSTNYGDLSNPTNWMNLVNQGPQAVGSWLAQSNPQLAQLFQSNPSLENYYAQQIIKSPGANPTEQAGSAQYWTNKALQDPGISGGSGSSGSSGGSNGTSAIGTFQNFAANGGFSPQDIADIRARAIAPTRAIYSNAQDNLNQQRRIQNGYAPNYIAGQAKLARDESSQIGDANVNADASIAQMIQQGKLYGATGLSNAQLGALGAQTGLYGTNPALINTFGNQVQGSAGNLSNLQGLQNQLSLGIMGAQNQKAGIPGNFQQALGNIGSTLGLIGTGAGLFSY